jgi:hypothetical protein
MSSCSQDGHRDRYAATSRPQAAQRGWMVIGGSAGVWGPGEPRSLGAVECSFLSGLAGFIRRFGKLDLLLTKSLSNAFW